MNISKQLKNYRKEFNISQEELAEIIHVSRQTISNWENSKSYPDLQSLLLLGEYFKISLDELVKGDIEDMKKELESKEIKANELKKLSIYSLILVGLMFITIPFIEIKFGMIIPVIFMVLILLVSIKIEKIKRDKNLKTYDEIMSYIRGKEIPRISEKERSRKVILQNISLPLMAFCVSLLIAYVIINYIL